jgi:hypothetical protein
MSFASEKESNTLFEGLPAAAETDPAEDHVTDNDEIDDNSAPHVPPDGGLHAWLKVVGGFLIYSNIW